MNKEELLDNIADLVDKRISGEFHINTETARLMISEEVDKYMRERSLFCDKLAVECFKSLEENIENVSNQLSNGLEIARFLSGLENRIAISLGMKLNLKRNNK